MSSLDQIDVQPKPYFWHTLQWPGWWQTRWHVSRLLLVLSALIAATLVLLVPAYLLFRMAGTGIEAFDILSQARIVEILLNTLLLAGSVTIAAILLAVPIAWLTVRTDLPGRRIWAILAALPLVWPSYVAAYVYMTILAPKGLLQQYLEPIFGIERLPRLSGFPGAFLVLTLITYPYIMLTARAALQRMDPSMLEAARSLGSSPWQAFRRITLPYLRPAIAAGALLVALYVLRDFGAVTMWQYNTFTRVIYNRYLSYRLDMAAALAFVVVIITVALIILESRTRGRARYGRISTGAGRELQPTRLGWWKIPSFVFLGTVVFISLILPAIGLLNWLARAWGQDWATYSLSRPQNSLDVLAELLQPALNSLSVSVAASLVVMILALPVAILAVRHSNRLCRLLERLTYVGYALPGIIVALALVFFGLQFTQSLYQTLVMLLVAYAILFLPQAVGSQRTSLLQVSPSLEEAARSLGKQPLTVFRRITFPLVRPGIFAGVALVFLTSMKELPATLILSPLGFVTLSTQIWSNVNEAFFARAAAPTLLLLLLSSLPLALLTIKEK